MIMFYDLHAIQCLTADAERRWQMLQSVIHLLQNIDWQSVSKTLNIASLIIQLLLAIFR